MEEYKNEDPPDPLIMRPYQATLMEIALEKNTIIHLPTGSGKTLIAMYVIKHMMSALKPPWGEGGKRTFFLVNNVPLVNQHRKSLKLRCPVDGVGGYSSKDGVDFWDKDKWDIELGQNQVIVMTSQILSDMLTHQYIRIEDINLLILDECHHAVEDHPMRVIMKHFEGCELSKQPRVIGLTATILNANANTFQKVDEILKNLETTLHATIATADSYSEVELFSTNPVESCVYYRPTVKTYAADEACSILKELQGMVRDIILPKVKETDTIVKLSGGERYMTDTKKITNGVFNIITGMITAIEEYGVYGGSLGVLAYMILLERLKRQSQSNEETTLYTMVITNGYLVRDILEESMENDTGYKKIRNHSSDHILKLLDILKEYNPAVYRRPEVCFHYNQYKSPLFGIIFAKEKFTTKILYNLLKEVIKVNPEEYGFIKHDYIVGFNINPMKNTRDQYSTKKKSEEALLKFENKDLNLLISTSVIEEGVDIPQCVLVVRFDRPLEFRSYVQSKGRARSAQSNFVIMVKEAERSKFMTQYKSYSETVAHIEKRLVGKSDIRAAPTSEDIQSNLYEDNEIPPYVSPQGGRLLAVYAISLLNRYCSGLPGDQFSTIAPVWIVKTIKSGVTLKQVVSIVLPMASSVPQKIDGAPYVNLKTAKRSAALNACIRLHQEGELDEYTMLPKPYAKIDFECPDIKQCFLNWPWDETEMEVEDKDDEEQRPPKPGTKKRTIKYDKVFPKCLNGAKKGQTTFYLHVLGMKTNFAKPDDSREQALYNLLQREEGYGLVTANPLPKICDFPMFLTVGEVLTNLNVNYASIELTPEHFNLVKRFHLFIFDQVLSIAKRFVVFDGTVNNMFVVPLKPSGDRLDVDWNVIKNFTYIPPVEEPPIEERRRLKVTEETYTNSVVSPWYRDHIRPDRYIVAKVSQYKTPCSKFGADEYETYENYFLTRYNLQIYGPKDQPMLEVRNITSRMNCLLPRAATLHGLSSKQVKQAAAALGDDPPMLKANTLYREDFVPEFCVHYSYPGVLWYKAVMLPSIVHRVTMLLVAEELRVQIATEAKLGKAKLPPGMSWQPVSTDQHVARASVLQYVEKPTVTAAIDRINNPIDPSASRSVKVSSIKDVIYARQRKNISEMYPWDEKSEPIDIERNISTVTLMDIECYDEFVNKPFKEITTVTSPSRSAAMSPKRMMSPQKVIKSKIKLLCQEQSAIGAQLKDIVAALTSVKSNDTFDLERAEVLGDSFLKFAATLYLFHKFPKLNEGQLTNIKGRLIGNRNLYYAGSRINLAGRMKVEQLSPRNDFLIPGFFVPKEIVELMQNPPIRPTFLIGIEFDTAEMLSGVLTDLSMSIVKERYDDDMNPSEPETEWDAQNAMQCYVKKQAVPDKTVADCVEALIGTYLLSDGVIGAIKILEWFRVIPKEDKFVEYLSKPVATVISEGKVKPADIDNLLYDGRKDIERIIGYTFKDSALLLEAMSHASYIRNRYTKSYERLEFLGDAVLDFIITSYIFENSLHLKPGDLTDLRSALVNNVTFASYVVRLGLHKYMCTDLNVKLDAAVTSFAEHQQSRGHEILEDVLYLIDEEDCNMAEYVDVPKALSDIFEALVGAMYLDTGGDLNAVWDVVYRIMHEEIAAFTMNIPKQPVRELYERVHACAVFGKPHLTNSEIPKVMMPVTISKSGKQVVVYGFGNNKFQAKRAAAKLALKVLDDNSGVLTANRINTVADCVEALIGTYLLSDGVIGAIKILEWFRVIPKEDKFVEYLSKPVATVISEGKVKPADIDNLLYDGRKDIERIIGYTFKDSALLLEAMSHASYIRNRYTKSYERLEFLGDAVLDFIITSYIFENSLHLKPGDLTDLRSALVNNVTFASYVVRLGLHKYMCTDLNVKLDAAVTSFAEHQQSRGHEILEDVLYLIDEEDCNMAEYVDVPKALSDIFEALVGAMYLDTGGDLNAVWDVVYRIMHEEIAAFTMNIPKQPVRELYERVHACAVFGKPHLTNSEIPKVMMPVTISKSGKQVVVYGFGNNKFQAKRAAAKLALKVLDDK